MPIEALFRAIAAGYTLHLGGIHGLPHWARVMETGERLAGETGADVEVVRLFALFHDARRVNDGRDDGHGARGAQFAATLRGTLITLDASRFEQLHYACTYHTAGLLDGDATVQTCWDADRLDLGRVGTRPMRRKLCTKAARDAATYDWADARACDAFEPERLAGWYRMVR